MKRIMCIVMCAAVLFPAAVFAAWKAGDKVEMRGKNSGIWFPSEIKKIEGAKYFVLIDGWNDEDMDETDASFLRKVTPNGVVTVRKGGSVWGTVSPDGTIRINGSIVGQFSQDGTVRKNGSEVGSVDSGISIRKNGSEIGGHTPMGEMRRNGSIIGGIDRTDGTIRLNGSIWGSIDGYSKKWRDIRAAVALLVFFADDFGY